MARAPCCFEPGRSSPPALSAEQIPLPFREGVVPCAFTGNDYEDIDYNSSDTAHVTIAGCGFVGNPRSVFISPFLGDTITTCTFRRNSGSDDYTLLTRGGAIVESILWGGTGSELPTESDTLVSFSNVRGGWPGVGNIDAGRSRAPRSPSAAPTTARRSGASRPPVRHVFCRRTRAGRGLSGMGL
jgi:hypothetical protein